MQRWEGEETARRRPSAAASGAVPHWEATGECRHQGAVSGRLPRKSCRAAPGRPRRGSRAAGEPTGEAPEEAAPRRGSHAAGDSAGEAATGRQRRRRRRREREGEVAVRIEVGARQLPHLYPVCQVGPIPFSVRCCDGAVRIALGPSDAACLSACVCRLLLSFAWTRRFSTAFFLKKNVYFILFGQCVICFVLFCFGLGRAVPF
jgi:hypothetical protein